MINRANLLKHYFLLSLAALDDEIAKLESTSEIIDYLKSITDNKIKGQVFNFVKSKKPQSIQEVKIFEADLLSKLDQKKNLQTSDISEELMITYNQLKSDKIKKYFRDLVKRKKIIASNDLLNKFNKIDHFVQENLKDTDITDYDFDKLYMASVKWENSFKQAPSVEVQLDNSRVVYGPNWKNNEFNGHFIYELKTEEELLKEGKDLNHCVGGYFHKLEYGIAKIFSLRTSSNNPLITIEASPDMFLFKQTFGYQNSQPNQSQKRMINEWKQSLHPKDEILNYANSYDREDRIQSAQFMDYNDPDYKNIIDAFIAKEKDSGKGFIGSETENSPKDVLQALSSNETLNEESYESIYMNAANNDSTVYNLIINSSISNDLYKHIYNRVNNRSNKYNYNIIYAFCQSRKLSENEDILKDILNSPNRNILIVLSILNNPSIKSSICISIINSLSQAEIDGLFSHTEFNNFEPKLIDDLLSSKINLKKYLTKIINYPNLSKDLLLKIYNLYKIKPILVTKEELFGELVDVDKFLYLAHSNLSDTIITDEELDYLIANKCQTALLTLSENVNLPTHQIDKLLRNNLNIKDEIDYNIKRNLSFCNNLSANQVEYMINSMKISDQYQFGLDFNKNQNVLRIYKKHYKMNEASPLLNHSNIEFDNLLKKYEEDSDYSDYHDNLLKMLAKNHHLNTYKIKRLFEISMLSEKSIYFQLGANEYLGKDEIDFILNNDFSNYTHYKLLLRQLTLNEQLNEEQTAVLLKKVDDVDLQSFKGKLPNSHFIELFKLNDSAIYDELALNKNLNEQQIDMLFNINDSLIKLTNMDERQSSLLKEMNNYIIPDSIANNPNLKSKHIDILLNKNDNYINGLLANNEGLIFNDLQFNKLLSNKNNRALLALNPNLTKEQCLTIVDSNPIALPKFFKHQKKASQSYQFKSLAYYQGTEEPTPGKKQYKSDKKIVDQPRFKEPFFKNYDLYETNGEHSPGSGWHNIMKYKSIKDFLNVKRKNKYKADDSWIEDNGSVSKKARNLFFLNTLIKNGIDFPIDDQVTIMPVKENNQIGGYLDKYLPENDSENKSPDKLNFGVIQDEFNKVDTFLGLINRINPDEEDDVDVTGNNANPEYGTTNSGNTSYNI